MTFKVVAHPTFSCSVIAQVPAENGEFREERFRARFKVIPTDQVSGYDFATEAGTRDFLAEAIASLDELVDGDNRPVAFTSEIRDQVIGLPYARMALIAAYFGGVTQARSGN